VFEKSLCDQKLHGNKVAHTTFICDSLDQQQKVR